MHTKRANKEYYCESCMDEMEHFYCELRYIWFQMGCKARDGAVGGFTVFDDLGNRVQLARGSGK